MPSCMVVKKERKRWYFNFLTSWFFDKSKTNKTYSLSQRKKNDYTEIHTG